MVSNLTSQKNVSTEMSKNVKNIRQPFFRLKPENPLPKQLRFAISICSFIAIVFVIGYLGYEDSAGYIMAFVSSVIIYFAV